jgi:hypothetical protein
MRISGELPSLNVSISDHHIREITALAMSIPLPEGDAQPADEIELDVSLCSVLGFVDLPFSSDQAPDIKNLANEGNAGHLVKHLPTGDESGYDSSTEEDEVRIGGLCLRRCSFLPQGGEKKKDDKEATLLNATDLELKFELKQVRLEARPLISSHPFIVCDRFR